MKKKIGHFQYVIWILMVCIACLRLFMAFMSGAFSKPDIPMLQAEGEIILEAIYKYRETYGRFPMDENSILSDENFPAEAKDLLRKPLRVKWFYCRPVYRDKTRDDFFIFRYTGHMGGALRYTLNKDDEGNEQYRWSITNNGR